MMISVRRFRAAIAALNARLDAIEEVVTWTQGTAAQAQQDAAVAQASCAALGRSVQRLESHAGVVVDPLETTPMPRSAAYPTGYDSTPYASTGVFERGQPLAGLTFAGQPLAGLFDPTRTAEIGCDQ